MVNFERFLRECFRLMLGSSIALNANTISVHYGLDLLRNLEKVDSKPMID